MIFQLLCLELMEQLRVLQYTLDRHPDTQVTGANYSPAYCSKLPTINSHKHKCECEQLCLC